jgi:hypothetical protein
MRRRIFVAVVVLHGLLLWLLASGMRMRPDAEPLVPQFVSLWITLPSLDTPPPPSEAEPQRELQRDPEQPLAPRPRAAQAPRTAPITLPSEPVVETTPQPSTSPAPAPALDWSQRAQLAARRSVDAGEAQKAQGESFSPAPEVMRKPCTPKKSNLDTAKPDETGFHMAGPLPVYVGKRCVFTLGFFACGLGKPPEPRSDLFDDMKGPAGAPSSVPHPEVCD